MLDRGGAIPGDRGMRGMSAAHVPQGTLLHLEAGAAFGLLGPQRINALRVNFAHFALAQIGLAAAVRLPAALAMAALGVGLATQAYKLGRSGPMVRQRGDVEQVLRLHDVVVEHSNRMGWSTPRLSSDRFTPYFNPGVVRLTAYERHGRFLNAVGGYGASLSSMTEAEVWIAQRTSDFVLLTLAERAAPRVLSPAEQSTRALVPALRAACEADFEPLGHFHFFGRDAVLYARRHTGRTGLDTLARG